MSGRIAIAKAILLSQFVYFLQILDIEKGKICKRIQKMLNDYIKGKTSRHWISEAQTTTPAHKGGQGFFCITKFTEALKIAFVTRYARGTDDQWCDLMDLTLHITPETRLELHDWGRRDSKR